MNTHLRRVRLGAGATIAAACLLGAPFAFHVANAQDVIWDFENGNTHGFTFLSVKPATAAPADPTTAGDESLTGVGGANGLPGAGLAWTVGPPNQFDGLKPAVVEGSHINTNGVLDYTLNGQPISSGTNFNMINRRGQSGYLNTYNLNQWGDGLNSVTNDQVARSPNVVLPTNAVLIVWSYGGGTGTQAPTLDPNPAEGYVDGSSGIAVRSAADNSLLASLRIDGLGTLKAHGLHLSAFAGQTAYIEVVDAFQGSFGWLAVDEIRITRNTINLNPDDITFEAEDFNFDNGQFIDNPVLSFSHTNSYYQKGSSLGVQGVDFNELNPTVHFAVGGVEWRFDGTGTVGGFANLPQTTNTFDAVRPAYVTAGIPDFDLATNSVNEWCGYTRTFPVGNYHIYARVASANPSTIRMDMVDNATTTNQNLTLRGWFFGQGRETPVLYDMVPLTDSTGTNLLVMAFNGTPKTLRLTALTGGFIANFYRLDPTNATENLIPTVSITSHTNKQVVTLGVQTTIEATATDDGTVTNVRFFAGTSVGSLALIGEDSTGPTYSMPYTPSGNEGNLIIRAVATDNAGLTSLQDVTVVISDPSFVKVTTAVGNGADNRLDEQSPFNVNNGTTLACRRQPGQRHEVAVVRFDLSAYDRSKVASVTFNVFSDRSYSTPYQVLLYAVLNSATNANVSWTPDTYPETALTYTNMPGMRPHDADLGTMDLDTNHMVLIQTNFYRWNIPGEDVIETFDSPSLTQFIKDHADYTNFVFCIEADAGGSSLIARITSKTATAVAAPANLTGAAGDFAPYLRFKVGALPSIVIAAFSLNGDQLMLQWTGGTGPYKIQKRTLITDAWADHLTGIAGTSATVTTSGGSGFYQVVGQ